MIKDCSTEKNIKLSQIYLFHFCILDKTISIEESKGLALSMSSDTSDR